MKNTILFTILFFTVNVGAVPFSIELIKTEIAAAEKNKDYEGCINRLTLFLADDDVGAADKYEAYILKANIYKTLFNYEHALYYLDEALTEGLQGTDRFKVRQRITAERALVYFDMQDFARSLKLMENLERSKYASLDKKYVLYLYTQKGFFLLKEKKYQAAEDYLHKALQIGLKDFPKELPIIYGKLMELYHVEGAFSKRDAAYRKGIGYARETGNVKYEFYIEEIMKNLYSSAADYKNAFVHQKKCDSLFGLYDSDLKISKLELLEKKLTKQQYQNELQSRRNIFIALTLFSFFLLLMLGVIFKLYIHTKKKNLMIEEDNKRIRKKIEALENPNKPHRDNFD